jgi:hypothetical protein
MPKQILHETTPRLAPPGAGIPLHHKLLLRFYVRPFVAAKTPIEASKRTFEKVTEKILQELQGLSEQELTQKVLVPPQTGLEDSSRFWSIAMTLEHLGIVGRKLCLVIEALSKGQTINEKADIGTLKPFGQMSASESLRDFQNFADEFARVQVPHPDSIHRFLHPWFGRMNCREWYWLLGAHQSIHLKQIRQIKKGLSARGRV